jgi:YbbR domain-containing protein
VLVTIGGSVADLDRLSGTTLVLTVDVTGLADGTHDVPVSANLQTGLTLVAASPSKLQVTVTPAPPASSPSPGPSPAP